MKKVPASQKLEVALRVLKSAQNLPVRTLCEQLGVSRQSAYSWAKELQSAAPIVFGVQKAPARINALERRNRLLQGRIDLLNRTLARNGIPIPPIRPEDLDQEDIETIGDTDDGGLDETSA